MNPTVDDWIASVRNGSIVIDIGQIDKPTARALDKLVRAGELVKWRGKWFPVTGAAWGLGLDKTCWARPEVRHAVF